MTVWINNPFDFLPGEGSRPQRYGLLCRALAQAGHHVVWWSSDWNHLEKVRRKCANAGMRELGNEGQIPRQGESPRRGAADPEIRLIKTMPYFKNVGVRRLISHWLYAKRWERMALAESEHPDLILCSAPPLSTGWVMRRLCKRLRCAGVIDVMDLWPETFERVAPAWLLWPLRWMAKRVYQGADGISAVGDSYLAVIREKYQSAVAVGSREARDKRKEERTPRQGAAVPGQCGNAGMRECANGTPRQGAADPSQGKPMYRCYHGIEMGGEVLKFESSKVLKLGENIQYPTSAFAMPTADRRNDQYPRMGEGVAVGSSSGQLGKRPASYDSTSAKAPSPHCPLPLPTANLKLVYVGNMGKGYDLETLVRAVLEMSEEGFLIRLDLAGRGEQEPYLRSLAQKKLSAIAFHGMITGETLGELLGQSDIGVVPMFTNTLVAVPYKLADYAAYGLPMVNSLLGETAQLLDHYGCGWHYEAGDVASLKQALTAAIELKKTAPPAFDARRAHARRLAEECFDAARIYPAFVRWLEALGEGEVLAGFAKATPSRGSSKMLKF